MLFLTGPRQVGKTTVVKAAADLYLNWDSPVDQRLIASGPEAVARRLGLDALSERRPVLGLDEFHKYGAWKNWLKGFFDTYGDRCRVLVTGSSRLDTYRRSGDSLMGRYFLCHVHPLSVGELSHPVPPTTASARAPRPISDRDFSALWSFGGFPEPWSRHSLPFLNRWLQTRYTQLVREEVRDLTRIHELGQLSVVADLLKDRSGEQLIFSNLAGEAHVAEDTARRWVDTLASLHFGFLVRPWFKNVAKSLRKEPKWYLTDWSGVSDTGRRAETLVACHLRKAVETWTDLGLGKFELRYLRNKAKREVDFVVIKDGSAYCLVEVKHGNDSLSPALKYFQDQTSAPHAFQVVLDAPFVKADCFKHRGPLVVPARTFLSQLP